MYNQNVVIINWTVFRIYCFAKKNPNHKSSYLAMNLSSIQGKMKPKFNY